jgi:ABC-type hemin transport system substrate-binding protein
MRTWAIWLGGWAFGTSSPRRCPLYPQITLEHILAWNPDVIVEVQGDDAFTPAAEARLREDWRRLPTLRANREGGVILLSGKSLTIPGPRVGETFAKLAVRLRPDVFSMSEEELLAEARTTTEIKKE